MCVHVWTTVRFTWDAAGRGCFLTGNGVALVKRAMSVRPLTPTAHTAWRLAYSKSGDIPRRRSTFRRRQRDSSGTFRPVPYGDVFHTPVPPRRLCPQTAAALPDPQMRSGSA
ncbi:hypothetical protein AUP68_01806 [Ilyonectria robusta]